MNIPSIIPVAANFTMVRGSDVEYPPIPHEYPDIHTYPFKENTTVVVIAQEKQNPIPIFSLIIDNIDPNKTKISINDNVLKLDQTIEIRSSQGNGGDSTDLIATTIGDTISPDITPVPTEENDILTSA